MSAKNLIILIIAIGCSQEITAGGPSESCFIYKVRYSELFTAYNASVKATVVSAINEINVFHTANPSATYEQFTHHNNAIVIVKLGDLNRAKGKIIDEIVFSFPDTTVAMVDALLFNGGTARGLLSCITNPELVEMLFNAAIKTIGAYGIAIADLHNNRG